MHSSDLSIEPSALQGLTPEEKDRLTQILDCYLSSLDSGVPLDREALLAAHGDLAGPLQTYLDSLDELHDVAARFDPPCSDSASAAMPPGAEQKRLGDFRLLREIGRGGMGVVYEARQISLDRRVALKVLPFAAVLDSRQIARFNHEAKAAAQLLHPNIVSVFAVGVERGVHYYAMQFIDGQPLDRAIAELRKAAGGASSGALEKAATGRQSDATRSWHFSEPIRPGVDGASDRAPPEESVGEAAAAGPCEAEDACAATCVSFLTTKARNQAGYFRAVARLGIQAAEALHAAHEHGIVHRDIKPSNLLLDGDGKLWVTDFGLARFQTDAPLTRTGDVVGTMRYMSPEQATGQSALIDHRTDVYSLAVTLYELLALQPAFPGEDGPALLRWIDQHEPRCLRHLQPKIPFDLETVVGKGMAKRRDERYTTAHEFADDLRRVLEGKPTLAKPPTVPKRLGKWARRHNRIVATAVAICMFALLGMATSTALIMREKIRAEDNFQRAEKHDRQAQEALDRLAETYREIGTLNSGIGSSEDAIVAQQNAIRLFQQLAAANPHEPNYRRHLALCQNHLALALRRSGRTDAARRACCDAIALQKELMAGADASEECLSELALSHNNLGMLQVETGERQQAENSFREAVRVQERLLSLTPENPEHLRNLAASLNNLSALSSDNQPARAAELYVRALAYQTKAAAAQPGEPSHQSDMALTYNNLGAVQARIEQLDEAAASYRRAIEIREELVRKAPAQQCYRCDLGVSYNNLGLTQDKLGQPSEAERSFRQALELQEQLVTQNPRDVDLQSALGGVYNNLGMVLEEIQRTGDAAEAFRKAVEHQETAHAQAPRIARYCTFLSKHYFNYGRVLRRLGRADDAARVALARRELWPNDPQHLFAVAEELALSGKLLSGSSRGDMSAEQCADYAIETLRQAAAAGWQPAADADWTESFAALKDHPRFLELVKH